MVAFIDHNPFLYYRLELHDGQVYDLPARGIAKLLTTTRLGAPRRLRTSFRVLAQEKDSRVFGYVYAYVSCV